MHKRDKKQRHKARREAKRKEARRRQAISPLQRLADAPGEIECWMSDNFAGFGQAQVFVYKQAAGLTGIAGFLIDKGVVGLKDAWAQTNVDRAQLTHMIQIAGRHDIAMRPATVDQARQMVAGGIKWAHTHGMRLPKDWAKPALLLGGVGDWASADVSAFVAEFAGHPEDLRRRLIAEPFESFIKRTDIHFIFNASAPYMDQEPGEYIDWDYLDEDDEDDEDEDEQDMIDDDLDGDDEDDLDSLDEDLSAQQLDDLLETYNHIATNLAEETAKWLTTRAQTPSPELFEVWRSLSLATLMVTTAMPDATDKEIADAACKLLHEGIFRVEESRIPDYQRAVEQVVEHFQTDPQLLARVLPQPSEGSDTRQE